MTSLILSDLFSKKTKIFVLVYFVLICFILYTLLPIEEEYYNLYFFKKEYSLTFNSMYEQIFKILTVLLTTIFVFNHDKSYLNNLTTKINRNIITFNKIIIYTFLVFLNMISIMILSLIILKFTNFKFLINKNYLYLMLFLLKDNILIMLILLFLTRQKSKLVALIIPVFYVLNSVINFTDINIIFYYLMPFSNVEYINYKNYNSYYYLFICFLTYINFIKYYYEDLN